jgi:hypothetical protein
MYALRDVASLMAVVSFVIAAGLWTDAIRMVL